MSEFDSLRPYSDNEVAEVLERLINDNEFLDAILKLKLSKPLNQMKFLFRGMVRSRLKKEAKGVDSVESFQSKIAPYLTRVVNNTTTKLTTSGLDALDSQKSYLFISNHRDIAMDSAFVNYSLWQQGFSSLRIAIGDNLLTKPFASDVMRLNKSFIVNRSATAPREKLKAAKLLSKYIHHSVLVDQENVWIAQREGRAKDGLDRTNAAIISMLSLSKPKTQSLSEYISEANIVPVSISYEYDPCDEDKARELYAKTRFGKYEKEEHEDVKSIARGITGFKGRVHLTFGDLLSGDYENSEQVTQEIDARILKNYRLHSTNVLAYELLEGAKLDLVQHGFLSHLTEIDIEKERAKFEQRLGAIDEHLRPVLLSSYANPVRDKLNG